jgi:hypothetical protein
MIIFLDSKEKVGQKSCSNGLVLSSDQGQLQQI